MDYTPFTYSHYVTGKYFIGRKQDVSHLAGYITQGRDVAIYAPPRTGKSSLIYQSLLFLKNSGIQFAVTEISLFNIRTEEDFAELLISNAAKATGCSESDVASLRQNAGSGIEGAVRLSYMLSQARDKKILIIIDQFSNLEFTIKGEKAFKAFHSAMTEMKERGVGKCSFIFTGNSYNAMNTVFAVRKDFYKDVCVMPLSNLEPSEIADYVMRGFLTSGKVIEKEDVIKYCEYFKCHPGYCNKFIFLCNSLAKGFINSFIFDEAMEIMKSTCESRFIATMNDLTDFQLSLLKAIIDGQKKLSSAEIIAEYSLNSSANVKRLKEALCKKEIVTFDANDNAVILDPYFENWLREYYFKVA